MYRYLQEQVKNLREIDFSSLYEDMEKVEKSGVMKLQQRRTTYQLVSDMCNYFPFWTELILDKPEFKQVLRQVKRKNFMIFKLKLFEKYANAIRLILKFRL